MRQKSCVFSGILEGRVRLWRGRRRRVGAVGVTRRDFAGLAAAAVLGAALPAQADAGADRCSAMLWSLEGAAKTFEERLRLVAAAGYRRVELVREMAAWDAAEWARVLRLMGELRLEADAIAPLKLGFADPAGGAAMLAELEAVLPQVRRFGRPQIILVSGPRAEGREREQRAAAVRTLGQVAEVMRREGMVAVIEPIDRFENPKVYLDGVREAVAMVREVGRPEVRVLYDFFHEQREHGNLIETLEQGAAAVGLVHIAGVPGRHQPGVGEVDFAAVYAALRRVGYGGVVAMEFYPEGDAGAVLRAAREGAERGLAGRG